MIASSSNLILFRYLYIHVSIELTSKRNAWKITLCSLRVAFDLAESGGIGCSLRRVSSKPVGIERCIHRWCIHRIRSSITRRIRRESRFVREHTSLAKCGRKSKIERTEQIASRSMYLSTYVRTYVRTVQSYSLIRSLVHACTREQHARVTWWFVIFFRQDSVRLRHLNSRCVAFDFDSLFRSSPWQVLSQTSTRFQKRTCMQCARANKSAICGYSLKMIRPLPEVDVSVSLSLSFFFTDVWMVLRRIKKEPKTLLFSWRNRRARITISPRIMYRVRYRKYTLT